MQNQIKLTERELKIRNYSPKTIKSYIYGLKEYFTFKEKDFEDLNEEIAVDKGIVRALRLHSTNILVYKAVCPLPPMLYKMLL